MFAKRFTERGGETGIIYKTIRRVRTSVRPGPKPYTRGRIITTSDIVSAPTFGCSESAARLAQTVAKVARSDASILIVGESGTGKELVARAIHRHSRRADRPFIPVNCGAIAPTLAEAEFFGHEKGSFTGAFAQNAGYFERADGGTLFLDEVTEMPLDMQVQILRVLETGEYHRVGGSEQIKVDVRVVSATNRNPYEAVAAGTFREDLLYRLAVVPVHVPPLRERKGDVEFLANRFLAEFNATHKTSKTLSRGSIERMAAYEWPGNVRELKNTLMRAYILAEQAVEVDPPGLARTGRKPEIREGCLTIPVGIPLLDAQQELIQATLAYHAGDKRRAARTLGISLKTLYNRLGQARKAS